jgi:transcriptional regulator with XRE-family HTH domain
MNNTDLLVSDKLLRMELANIRKSKKMSQKDLSKVSGLSESCISNIESGEQSSPTLRSLIRYATALGVEIYIKNENKGDN